jgi:glycine cleavage system protein P-like pyridoxal-binding family
MDFATFEAPQSWRVNHEQLMQCMKNQNCFSQESLDFMSRMLSQSGVGPATAWPPGIVQTLEGKPTENGVEASREEAKV